MNNEALPLVPVSGDTQIYQENLDQCLKGEYQLEGTVYHNVCTGESNFVPNGFWDYSVAFTFLGLGLLVVVTFFKVIFD